MNKQLTLLLAVAALFIVGIGGFFLYSKNNKPQVVTTQAVTTQKPASNHTKSLLELLTSGQTTKCTFETNTSEKSQTTGTVYISGNNMRGQFTTKVNGKASNINLIRVGDQSYIWGDDLPSGIKMKLSAKDLSQNNQTKQYIDANNKTNYNCSPWVPDASQFTPPTNVKFTDYSSMMKMGTGESGAKMDSSICNQIADADAKASCIKAVTQQ